MSQLARRGWRALPKTALALALTSALGLAGIPGAFAADKTADLQARVSKLEQSLNNRGLLDLLAEIETLKREVASLRGELENQAYLIEQAKRVQAAGYSDLDARLQAMGGGGVTQMAAPPPPLQVLQGSPVEAVAGTLAPQGNLQVQNQPPQGMAPAAGMAPVDASGMPVPPPPAAIDPATGLPLTAMQPQGAVPGMVPQPMMPQGGVYPPSAAQYPPGVQYPPAAQPQMPAPQAGQLAPGTPPGMAPQPVPGMAPQAGMPPAAGADEAAAEQAYQAAFSLLKSGEYDQAIAAFANFQQQFPASQFGDNAQYWMAEAYYVKGDFAKALPAYQTMLVNYPASKKLSHAMLKIGYSYAELGKAAEARAVLTDVQQRFPGSAAAQLAAQRVAKLPAAKR